MSKKGNLLIVDDKKNVLRALELLLEDDFDQVITLNHPKSLVSTLQQETVDVILLDMNYTAGQASGNEGLFWLQEIKKYDKNIEIVLFTAYGDVELAVKGLKLGACDFILKPWDNNKLLATLKAAMKLHHSNLEVKALKKNERQIKKALHTDKPKLIGKSAPMQAIKNLIHKVAKTDANILITGENGTGKEVIAKEIHHQSLRNNELLVSVDVSALPETLIESELFGHVKGAFTDAKEDRIGKFQLAHNGTLFLDEIGNIPLSIQSKLLVALQTRTITPVGSNKEIPIDIRLITASNSNIPKLIEEQLFRQDLLYRINTITIEVPSLKERVEDIHLLAHFFREKYANKYMNPSISLSKNALKKLEKYHWPGNVRELEHTIEKAIILSDGKIINEEDFYFRTDMQSSLEEAITLEEMEKNLIISAIAKQRGNLSMAAKQLGVTRQTLYNKLKRYDI